MIRQQNIYEFPITTGDANGNAIGMNDLTYAYENDNGNSNLLKNVSDAVSTQNTDGFVDGNTSLSLDDYEYDSNGNMILDRNKGIENISYNYLNLPTEILWSSSKKIQYLYNASGQKVQKKVTNGTSIKITDYLDGFQYNQQLLEFFPHSEGYVKVTAMGLTPNNPNYAFNYVYNYTDHLGNIRVNYTKDPQTGLLKILDESHYYPFGLKHQEYSNYGFIDQNSQVIIAPIANNPYQYKYNGKELQDELGLNMYDYGARNYDPALGRFFNLDRLSEKYESFSPYSYVANSPVRLIDINGEWIYIYDEDKKYRYQDGKAQSQNDDGEWFDADTKSLSGYVSDVVGLLNNLSDSGKTGKGLVDFFSNDKENVDIKYGKGTQEYSDGVITFDNKYKYDVFTLNGTESNIPFIDLGHELGHRMGDKDPRYWFPNSAIWYGSLENPTSKNEIIASHIENQIRAESGLSLRTHYGSVNGSPQKVSRLIDSKGNSIYFRSGGGMRDFGEGMNIMIQIRNGGIINSRMKIGDKAIGYPYNYPTQNPKTQ